MTAALIQDSILADRLQGHKGNQLEGPHIQRLIKAIRECDVSFQVWESSNPEKSGGKQFDCTSLIGPAKKLLPEKLPSKLNGCISTDTASDVTKLWNDFYTIYQLINQKSFTEEELTELRTKCKAWIEHFCCLGQEKAGYGKKKVTPICTP